LANTIPNFYTDELIYYDQFQPTDQLNTVYFPVCKYTLDMDAFIDWLSDTQPDEETLAKVYVSIKGKDKEPILKELQELSSCDSYIASIVPFWQTFILSQGGAPMTSLTNFSVSNVLNVWWSLPQGVQDKVKSLVPNKDSWTLNCSKDSSGVWVFSLPQFLTLNESLCNGTELVMDYWYQQLSGKEPVKGDKLKVVVSKVQPKEYTTKVVWMYSDPYWTESNYYYDKGSDMDLWLCPYVQVLFKEVPQSMWLTLTPQ
jgi:hypothetical protein